MLRGRVEGGGGDWDSKWSKRYADKLWGLGSEVLLLL